VRYVSTGVLVLEFSEMMEASSFDASGLVFESLDQSCFMFQIQGRTQSSCNATLWASYQSYGLNKARTVYGGPDNETLVLQLSEFDTNAIKVQ
jgi:hypothetical protein